jgi:tetratricopeptide (TPR) repeat protein
MEKTMHRLLIAMFVLLAVVSCGDGDNEKTVDLMAKGKEAFRQGDYYEARLAFAQLQKMEPTDRDYLYWLGRTYRRELMYDSAVLYLKQADYIYPKDSAILAELYRACRGAGEWQEGRRAAEDMVRQGMADDSALVYLVELSIRSQEFLHTLYYTRELIARNPGEPQYYLDAVNAAAEVDSVSAALEIVNRAIERFGPLPQFLAAKGFVLAGMNRLDQAEAVYRELLGHDTSSVEFKINLANVLSQQPSREKKRQAYQLYAEASEFVQSSAIDSIMVELADELGIGQASGN